MTVSTSSIKLAVKIKLLLASTLCIHTLALNSQSCSGCWCAQLETLVFSSSTWVPLAVMCILVTCVPLFGISCLWDNFPVYQTGKRDSSASVSQQNHINSFWKSQCQGVRLSHPSTHSERDGLNWVAVLRCQREGGNVSYSLISQSSPRFVNSRQFEF